jgi:hypothetical protein
MNRIVVLSVAAVIAVGGTAWAQGAGPAKPESPFKQLTGSWEGVARTADGLPYPIRADIDANGKARHAAPGWLPSAKVTPGAVIVRKDQKSGLDVMQYASGQDEPMTLDMDVVDGRRVLRLTKPDGSVIELFERTDGKKR